MHDHPHHKQHVARDSTRSQFKPRTAATGAEGGARAPISGSAGYTRAFSLGAEQQMRNSAFACTSTFYGKE